MAQSNIWNLQVDEPIVQDADFEFDDADRGYIDSQIRGLETLLVQGSLSGLVGTWATNDAGNVALTSGDVVCLSGLTAGTIVTAASSALASAGSVYGVVVVGGPVGAQVFCALKGKLAPAITGLPTSGNNLYACVTSGGRIHTKTALSTSDHPLGTVDAAGNLTLDIGLPADAVTSSAGVSVEQGGSSVGGDPHTTLNFTGSGVTASDAGGGVATINIPGGGGFTNPKSVFIGGAVITIPNAIIAASTSFTLASSIVWVNAFVCATARTGCIGPVTMYLEYSADSGVTWLPVNSYTNFGGMSHSINLPSADSPWDLQASMSLLVTGLTVGFPFEVRVRVAALNGTGSVVIDSIAGGYINILN